MLALCLQKSLVVNLVDELVISSCAQLQQALVLTRKTTDLALPTLHHAQCAPPNLGTTWYKTAQMRD